MSKKVATTLALSLSALATSVSALNLNEASAYLTRGLAPVFASAAFTSKNKHSLQARSNHLQKRYEVCSIYYVGDEVVTNFCKSPTHCLSDTTCSFNYLWIVGAIILVLIIIGVIFCCRRRNANSLNSSQMVMTQVTPGAGNSTVTYQPAMAYAQQPQPGAAYNPPSAYDPNQVQQLQFPSTYVAPNEYQAVPASAGSPYYPPQQQPAGSPYPAADPLQQQSYQQQSYQQQPGAHSPYPDQQPHLQAQHSEYAAYQQPVSSPASAVHSSPSQPHGAYTH